VRRIGVFGGTFDPVHNGHLQMAIETKKTLGLDEVRLVPCHRPPHRDCPLLSSQQRLQLLSLAVAEHEGLLVDDRELRRDQPSYTVDTLRSLRQELGDTVSVVLILGMDAFASLTSWSRWQEIRQLAHIAVFARPDTNHPSDQILQEWIAHADAQNIVGQQAAGGFMILTQSLLAISATQIRQQLMHNEPSVDIPKVVAQYIEEQGFYQQANID
jgi:nicotinate-nucleotide adenylyltransferase